MRLAYLQLFVSVTRTNNTQNSLPFHNFLLLASYLPNVAKRSIWDQCKKYIIEDRPTIDLSFGKISNALSPRGVIRLTPCLVLMWGFRGRKIEWRYFQFDQIQDDGSATILENSNGHISTTDYPIHSVFRSRMGFSLWWIEWSYFELCQIQQVCGRKQYVRSN